MKLLLRIKTVLIFPFLICAYFAIGQSSSANGNMEQITATLIDYIEGSTNGQPERLKTAFHPDLNLYSIRKDSLRVWSGKDYIADTKEGKPTGEEGRILSIDFENDAAVAKVEISHPDYRGTYIDYFMLLKVEGHWTIIHKMYTLAHSNKKPPKKK